MGNDAKVDPILRVVLVVFAGLLVFSFLFGTNFGGTGQVSGHHGAAAAGGGGYYFGGVVAGLVSFLINILLLVLVFALIAGLVMGVRKLINNCKTDSTFQNCQVMNVVNQDPVLRVLLMAVVGIFALYIIAGIFRSLEFGVGYGFTPYSILFVLLGFLLKLLMLGLVVSLTVALVQYLKAQFFDAQNEEKAPASGNAAIQAEAQPSPALTPANSISVLNQNSKNKSPDDREKK